MLAELSRRNVQRLHAEIAAEFSRLRGLTPLEFARMLEVSRWEVGANPPIGVSMTMTGLALVLHHGRLFTMWDAAAGKVANPAMPGQPMALPESEWRPRERHIVESALGQLVGWSKPPVYGALAATTGYDRLCGGMFDHRFRPVTVELPFGCEACFHWGDSFDPIVDQDGSFETSWVLGSQDVLHARSLLDCVRRHNRPIVGREDLSVDDPRVHRVVHLGRVTPLYMEAMVVDPPPLDTLDLVVRTGSIVPVDAELWASLRPRCRHTFRAVVEIADPDDGSP